MNRAPPTETGQRAEYLARRHLERHGLRHVESNYRCRRGEIDLVMRDGRELVFVEVRFRARADYGQAADTIGPVKRGRIIFAANHYLHRHGLDVPCRIDVVAVDADHVDWIINAIESD